MSECALLDHPVPFLADLLSPGAAVLDVGSGDGSFAAQFARCGFDVTALNPKALEERAVPFRVLQVSLENFHPGTSYDLVFARMVEHLLKGRDTCENLGQLARLVGPGGLLYVTLLGDRDAWARGTGRKEEAQGCLRTLGFETARIEEYEFERNTYAGESKHWHVLAIVAKRVDPRPLE